MIQRPGRAAPHPATRLVDPQRAARRADAAVGSRVATAIAEVVRALPTGDAATLIAQAARRHSADLPPGWLRMRARQTLHLRLAAYLAHHHPGPAWTLVGAEMALGSGRADLVWTSDAGVLIDELKARLARGPLPRATREQCARYLAAGATMFPGRFLGVRLISLSDPSRCRCLSTLDQLDEGAA